VHPQQMIVFGVAAVLFVALFAWRIRRMMTATSFNPYGAWILPAILLVMSALLLFQAKPGGMEWVWVVGLFALGLVVGYFRGKSITINRDPATGRLLAQGSAVAIVFIILLIAARYGLSYLLQTNASAVHLRPIMANVLPAVLGAGLFTARSIEMGIRGHKVLEAAKTAPATAILDAP
jgi:uncharacterized membrane protein